MFTIQYNTLLIRLLSSLGKIKVKKGLSGIKVVIYLRPDKGNGFTFIWSSYTSILMLKKYFKYFLN
jgi:hypothetical protein